jgi:hypothetical protein
MGDSMPPLYVTKDYFGPIDDIFVNGNTEIYDAALMALRAQNSILDVAREAMGSGPLDPGISGDDLSHFEGHWLGDWWPDQPVDNILRAGMIRAIEVALELELPLETTWVHGGPRFQVYVLQGAHQVTALVLTPSTPPNAAPQGLHREIQVIRERHFRDDENSEGVDNIEGVVVQRYGSPMLS